jgi:hypothetical protein
VLPDNFFNKKCFFMAPAFFLKKRGDSCVYSMLLRISQDSEWNLTCAASAWKDAVQDPLQLSSAARGVPSRPFPRRLGVSLAARFLGG